MYFLRIIHRRALHFDRVDRAVAYFRVLAESRSQAFQDVIGMESSRKFDTQRHIDTIRASPFRLLQLHAIWPSQQRLRPALLPCALVFADHE
jgi:hypothetical protein